MITIDQSTLQKGPVKLELLSECHIDRLRHAASDPLIWQHHKVDYHQPEMFNDRWLRSAFEKMQAKKRYVFVVYFEGEIIGSTSYYDIDPDKLEMKIGYTWYNPAYWGQGINPVVKRLMLKYAFEDLNFDRVLFCIDTENKRSRASLAKLKIPFDHVVKKHMRRGDGSLRDSAIYVLTKKEQALTS